MTFSGTHVEERLTAFLDHELAGTEAAGVERHLDACGRCREAARSIERARLAARFVPDYPPPPGLARRLEQRLFAPPAPVRRSYRLAFSMAVAAAAAAVIFISAAVERRRMAAPPVPAVEAAPDPLRAFDQTALRLHRERIEGSLPFEICDSSRKAVSDWVCREAGLDLPRSPLKLERASLSGSECAAIVPEAGGRIAVVALEVGRRPVTLLTTRSRTAFGESAAEGRVTTRKDPATGLEVESWTSGGQAYAAVSQGND